MGRELTITLQGPCAELEEALESLRNGGFVTFPHNGEGPGGITQITLVMEGAADGDGLFCESALDVA